MECQNIVECFHLLISMLFVLVCKLPPPDYAFLQPICRRRTMLLSACMLISHFMGCFSALFNAYTFWSPCRLCCCATNFLSVLALVVRTSWLLWLCILISLLEFVWCMIGLITRHVVAYIIACISCLRLLLLTETPIMTPNSTDCLSLLIYPVWCVTCKEGWGFHTS